MRSIKKIRDISKSNQDDIQSSQSTNQNPLKRNQLTGTSQVIESLHTTTGDKNALKVRDWSEPILKELQPKQHQSSEQRNEGTKRRKGVLHERYPGLSENQILSIKEIEDQIKNDALTSKTSTLKNYHTSLLNGIKKIQELENKLRASTEDRKEIIKEKKELIIQKEQKLDKQISKLRGLQEKYNNLTVPYLERLNINTTPELSFSEELADYYQDHRKELLEKEIQNKNAAIDTTNQTINLTKQEITYITETIQELTETQKTLCETRQSYQYQADEIERRSINHEDLGLSQEIDDDLENYIIPPRPPKVLEPKDTLKPYSNNDTAKDTLIELDRNATISPIPMELSESSDLGLSSENRNRTSTHETSEENHTSFINQLKRAVKNTERDPQENNTTQTSLEITNDPRYHHRQISPDITSISNEEKGRAIDSLLSEHDISRHHELTSTRFGNQIPSEIFPKVKLDHITDSTERNAYLDVLYHYAQELYDKAQKTFQQDEACQNVLQRYNTSQIYYKWYKTKELIAVRDTRYGAIFVGPSKNSLRQLGVDPRSGPYLEISMQDLSNHLKETDKKVQWVTLDISRPLYRKEQKYGVKTGPKGLYLTDNYVLLTDEYGGSSSTIAALYNISRYSKNSGPWTLPDGAIEVEALSRPGPREKKYSNIKGEQVISFADHKKDSS